MCIWLVTGYILNTLVQAKHILINHLLSVLNAWLVFDVVPAYSMLRGPRYSPSTVVMSPAQPGQSQFIQSPPWASTPVYANGSPQKNMLWSVDRSPYAVTRRSPLNVTHWQYRWHQCNSGMDNCATWRRVDMFCEFSVFVRWHVGASVLKYFKQAEIGQHQSYHS